VVQELQAAFHCVKVAILTGFPLELVSDVVAELRHALPGLGYPLLRDRCPAEVVPVIRLAEKLFSSDNPQRLRH
jgi:hypothetical protein